MIRGDSIRLVAQQASLGSISTDVVEEVRKDAEARMRDIIRDAIKFQTHSMRAKLTTDDVDRALKIQNVDPVYGHASSDPVTFHQSKTYPDMFFQADPIVNFDDVLKEPLPPLPLDTTFSVHWLAIEGEQPDIPQNPTPAQIKKLKSAQEQTLYPHIYHRASLQQQAAARQRTSRPLRAHPAPSPASLASSYTRAAAGRIGEAISGGVGIASSGDGLGMSMGDVGKETAAEAEATKERSAVQRKSIVKHVLSREQRMYFEYITSAVKTAASENDTGAVDSDSTAAQQQRRAVQEACYESLLHDAGLHQLVPYFTQFIADEVPRYLRCLPVLTSLMRMAHCLLLSEHIHLEPYLHQLMPPILTCLVGKRLCDAATEDHWALRKYAARLVALVCDKFGYAYHTLQPRITKTLSKALLDPWRPLTTHYGAIIGLSSLGHHVTKLLILPHLPYYLRLLRQVLDETDNPVKRVEANHCYGALLLAAGRHVREEMSETEHLSLKELALRQRQTRRRREKKRRKRKRGAAAGADDKGAGKGKGQAFEEEEGEGEEPSKSVSDILFALFGEALLPYMYIRQKHPNTLGFKIAQSLKRSSRKGKDGDHLGSESKGKANTETKRRKRQASSPTQYNLYETFI